MKSNKKQAQDTDNSDESSEDITDQGHRFKKKTKTRVLPSFTYGGATYATLFETKGIIQKIRSIKEIKQYLTGITGNRKNDGRIKITFDPKRLNSYFLDDPFNNKNTICKIKEFLDVISFKVLKIAGHQSKFQEQLPDIIRITTEYCTSISAGNKKLPDGFSPPKSVMETSRATIADDGTPSDKTTRSGRKIKSKKFGENPDKKSAGRNKTSSNAAKDLDDSDSEMQKLESNNSHALSASMKNASPNSAADPEAPDSETQEAKLDKLSTSSIPMKKPSSTSLIDLADSDDEEAKPTEVISIPQTHTTTRSGRRIKRKVLSDSDEAEADSDSNAKPKPKPRKSNSPAQNNSIARNSAGTTQRNYQPQSASTYSYDTVSSSSSAFPGSLLTPNLHPATSSSTAISPANPFTIAGGSSYVYSVTPTSSALTRPLLPQTTTTGATLTTTLPTLDYSMLAGLILELSALSGIPTPESANPAQSVPAISAVNTRTTSAAFNTMTPFMSPSTAFFSSTETRHREPMSLSSNQNTRQVANGSSARPAASTMGVSNSSLSMLSNTSEMKRTESGPSYFPRFNSNSVTQIAEPTAPTVMTAQHSQFPMPPTETLSRPLTHPSASQNLYPIPPTTSTTETATNSQTRIDAEIIKQLDTNPTYHSIILCMTGIAEELESRKKDLQNGDQLIQQLESNPRNELALALANNNHPSLRPPFFIPPAKENILKKISFLYHLLDTLRASASSNFDVAAYHYFTCTLLPSIHHIHSDKNYKEQSQFHSLNTFFSAIQTPNSGQQPGADQIQSSPLAPSSSF